MKRPGDSKRKIIFVGIAVIVTGLIAHELFMWAFWDYSPNYLAADRCLDTGGCWDAIDSTCRKNEPNAEVLCGRNK